MYILTFELFSTLMYSSQFPLKLLIEWQQGRNLLLGEDIKKNIGVKKSEILFNFPITSQS